MQDGVPGCSGRGCRRCCCSPAAPRATPARPPHSVLPDLPFDVGAG